MIEQDFTQRYEHDYLTCAHRVERHHSKRESPSRPRIMNHVCLVEGKAITEHGTRMQVTSTYGANGDSKWVYEVPCKIFDRKRREWVPCDWEPRREA